MPVFQLVSQIFGCDSVARADTVRLKLVQTDDRVDGPLSTSDERALVSKAFVSDRAITTLILGEFSRSGTLGYGCAAASILYMIILKN